MSWFGHGEGNWGGAKSGHEAELGVWPVRGGADVREQNVRKQKQALLVGGFSYEIRNCLRGDSFSYKKSSLALASHSLCNPIISQLLSPKSFNK